jgi:hypothetical protein
MIRFQVLSFLFNRSWHFIYRIFHLPCDQNIRSIYFYFVYACFIDFKVIMTNLKDNQIK